MSIMDEAPGGYSIMVNGTGINFSGLASGLDTNAIVKQLVALERIPIQMIENQKAAQEAKLNKINQFAELVKAMKIKAEALSSLDSFYAFTVGGSFEGFASITADSSAVAGSHSLEVLSMAGTDRWAFDGVADSTVDLAVGPGETIDFTVNGTVYSIAIDQATSSLDQIAAGINNAAADDVTASVVNVGTSANPSYQLVLASDASGEDYRLSAISSTVAGLTINYVAPDVNGDPQSANNVAVGTNAVAIIDGLTVTRSTNDFSTVLPGVSLNIESQTTGPVTFTVQPDKTLIKEKLDDFITAYNEVIDFIDEQSTYTPSDEDGEAGDSGILFGDSILRSVTSTVQSALFNVPISVIQADTEGYSTLSLVGISADQEGRLSMDETKFNEKFDGDLEAFADLFVDTDGFVRDPAALPNTSAYYQDTTADSGLMASLARNLDQLFGSLPDTSDDFVLKGVFDLKEDVITETIKRMNAQIDTKERHLQSFETDLILRFAKLEELMGALNAQGAALAGTLFG